MTTSPPALEMESSPISKKQGLVASLGVLASRPVARGAIVSLVVRIVALGLGFLQAVLTARLLGPEAFGTVAFALSVATILGTLAMLGFGPLAVREVARLSVREDWGTLRAFLRYSGLAVCVGALACAGVVALLATSTDLFDARFRREVALAALVVPPSALLLYFRGVHQGLGKVLSAQIPGDVLRSLLLVVSLMLLLMVGSEISTIGYLWVTVGVGLVAATVAAVSFWVTLSRGVPATPVVVSHRPWAWAAAPFLAMTALGVLGGEMNTLLLGWLSGPRETGLFQPVARIAPVMLIGLQAVSVPFAPRVAALWEQSETERLRKITWMVSVTTTAVTIVTCAALVGLAPLIFLAFGKVFLVTTGAVLVVAAAQILNAACGPVGMLLSMTGHQWISAACQFGGLVVNTVLGFWLIPQSGAHGAAIAYAGGIAGWNLLMLGAVRRVLGFDASVVGARMLMARGNRA